MRNYTAEILAVILICMAGFLLVHQRFIRNDVWFTWQQFLHHESFITCCVVAAIALIAGKYLGRG